MTTITITRSSAVAVSQATPTKKAPANPKTLDVFNFGTNKEIRTLLGFTLPAEVLAPGTTISAAVLTVRNQAKAIASSITVGARRAILPWTASNATWATTSGLGGFVDASDTTVTKATTPANGTWQFNVLTQLSEAAAAGVFYGFELRKTNNSNVGSNFKLFNSGALIATLTITYSIGPALPTQLSPAFGQAVATDTPTLKITSPPAGDPIHQMSIQLDPAQDGVTPEYDSGWFDTLEGAPMLDTSDPTAQGAAAFTPLDESVDYYWRVKVRDLEGSTTGYTPWALFKYESLGTLVMNDPDDAPDNQVTDPSPTTAWTLTGRTQRAYRLWFTDPSLPVGQNTLWDSGVVTSTDTSASPSVDVATVVDHVYEVHLRVWDDINRVVTGGVTDNVQIDREFTFELSAGVDPVTSFTVEDLDPLPFVKLSFTSTEAPDFFQIVRDDVSVGLFTPGDLFVSGDDYEWVDYYADPRREHTWIVRRVVDGETSATNTPVTLTINPPSIWLCDPDNDHYLPFITMQAQAVGLTEDGATFNVLGAVYGVRITGSLRGWSGTIEGEILATPLTDDQTGAELRDMFLAMRLNAANPMVLSLLDKNLKVVPFNMTVAPTPTLGKNEDYVYAASFEFIEVG